MLAGFPEKNDVIYIPTGNTYSGGLAEVRFVEGNIVSTDFGSFDWEALQTLQSKLHEIFETEKAAQW